MQTRLWVKVIIILGLTLFLLIPLGMIRGVISERSGYRNVVEQDIARSWAGRQLLAGPILLVPYEVGYEEEYWNPELKQYQNRQLTRRETAYVIAERISLSADIVTEERFRGIYSVPVYTGHLQLDGMFSSTAFREVAEQTDGFRKWGEPQLSLVVQDIRGIGIDPRLTLNNQSMRLVAGSLVPNLDQGMHADVSTFDPENDIAFSFDLNLRGSRALNLAPLAETIDATANSAWPHPKFTGRFLPTERQVSADGFQARWQISSLSMNAEHNLESCVQGHCDQLRTTSFGVEFIEAVDIYRKVMRATKYGILFVLLTFVAFFLTETLLGKILHPIHYALVGFTLTIFYLLLISLSEHLGFAISYVIATAASVGLIGIYLSSVLASLRQGCAYALSIALLYAMLFAILHSEDFALLMGSLLLFAMLTAVMTITRNVDWYRLGKTISASR